MPRESEHRNRSLRSDVEQLIERKLRHLRHEEENRLTSTRREAYSTLNLHVRDGLNARKSSDAIRVRMLAAYRTWAAQVIEVTEAWPAAVWDAIASILDQVSVDSREQEAIAGLLDAHIWRLDETPWTIAWVDADQFADVVNRVLGQYGFGVDLIAENFQARLSQEAACAHAGIANRGRAALAATHIRLEEYLLIYYDQCRESVGNSNTETSGANDLAIDHAEEMQAYERATADQASTREFHKRSRNESESLASSNDTESRYISYPRAMRLLNERLDATPEELAVWVSFGSEPKCGGIPAYLEANISERPRLLTFDCWSEADFDYIAPLMSAWFVVKDIAQFDPSERYITYPALFERWSASDQLPDVAAFIVAKVREDQLHESHPVTLQSQLSLPDYEYPRPPKESTMLPLSEIRAIEHEDAILVPANETADERKQRLQAWFEEEQRKNPHGAQKRTAKREGISRQTLSAILKRD